MSKQKYIYVTSGFWEDFEKEDFPYSLLISKYRLLVTTPEGVSRLERKHAGIYFDKDRTALEIIDLIDKGVKTPLVCDLDAVAVINDHYSPPIPPIIITPPEGEYPDV